MKSRQRGFIYSDSNALKGCAWIVAIFFILVGVLLSWIVPVLWHNLLRPVLLWLMS